MNSDKDIPEIAHQTLETLQSLETLDDLEANKGLPVAWRLHHRPVPEDRLGYIAICIIGVLVTLGFLARIFGLI